MVRFFLSLIALCAMAMPSLAQKPVTYSFGQEPTFQSAPATAYKPVDPRRELPAREWDPRTDATREVMRHLNATVCPTARTFVECWTEAPPRAGNKNVKQGFMVLAVIAYEGGRGSIMNRMLAGKLPAEYGGALWQASADVASGIFRADCDAAFVRFTNMRAAVPKGPYPVIGWHGQVRESVFIDTVAREGSQPGFGVPSTMVRMHRGQALLALPEIIFSNRANNPIGQVNVFHGGIDNPLLHLPQGAAGLFTIPASGKHENDFLRAIRETGMLRIAAIVEKGACPRFDFANFRANQPQRR